MQNKNGDIKIFQGEDGEIKLNIDVEKETVWLSLNQIAELFGKNKSTISRHIKNIFESGELSQEQVVAIFATTASDGKAYQVEYFNLDMIISVGYRVDSKQATKFRIWATKILKEHITKGFTINQNQIEENYKKFFEVVDELKLKLGNGSLSSDEILELVKTFSGTWLNLDNFDKGNLPESGFTEKDFEENIEILYKDLENFKKELIKKGEATEMFAQEKNTGNLKGIFGNVFGGFGGEDFYSTIEEKAAHLLYFIVKNHPFNDGNKRSGAFAFIWLLQKSGIEFKSKISPETLTVLTLLIAQSNPKEKERMVGLILLILKK